MLSVRSTCSIASFVPSLLSLQSPQARRMYNINLSNFRARGRVREPRRSRRCRRDDRMSTRRYARNGKIRMECKPEAIAGRGRREIRATERSFVSRRPRQSAGDCTPILIYTLRTRFNLLPPFAFLSLSSAKTRDAIQRV